MELKLNEYKSKRENYHIGLRIEDLKSILRAQADSTTQDDPYMRGMTNGLLLAWNIIAEPYGAEVPYLNKPASSAEST